MTRQCTDLDGDRRKGAKAEEEFCNLLEKYDYDTLRLQYFTKVNAASIIVNNKVIVLGDIFVISPINEVFIVEIKEKYPNKYDSYGLEEYRLKHYLDFEKITGIPVIYAIKDTYESGRWYWNNFKELLLFKPKQFPGHSWVGGVKQRVEIYYFKKIWFRPIIKNNIPNQIWDGAFGEEDIDIIRKIRCLAGRQKFDEIMCLINSYIKK